MSTTTSLPFSSRPPRTLGTLQKLFAATVGAVTAGLLARRRRRLDLWFRRIADAAPVMLWRADTDRDAVWCNQAWCEFTGRSAADATAGGWSESIHPDDRARRAQEYARAFEQRLPFTSQHRMRRASGEWHWVLERGAPLLTPRGRFLGYVGSVSDTEELHATQEALRARAADATAANAELQDFLYMVSHDVKEPLRGIELVVTALLEDHGASLPAECQQKLGSVMHLASHLSKLVDRLLDYQRIHRLELQPERTDMLAVAQEVVDLHRLAAEHHGVQLHIKEPLPTIVCDRVRAAELLRNLVSNGIKYNDKEQKSVEIGVVGGASDARSAAPSPVFYVRDNGIGIAPRHHQEVFKMFRRLHVRDAFGGGTGAGLALAKRIVEQHGGRIWLESAPGAGSTFFFSLGGSDTRHHHGEGEPAR